jgi:hypothetical protein
LRPDDELVPDACARLRGVPALLEQARDNLDPSLASPLLVRRAIAQARGGVTYTGEQVGDAVSDPGLAGELRAAGQVASAAYDGFVPFLEDLAERATGDWAIGEERYDALLTEKEGLPYGTRALRERGREEYAALEAEMRRLTRVVAGHEDWKRLVDELNRDAPETPDVMRREYAEWTERSRAFVAEHGLVTCRGGDVRGRPGAGVPARLPRRRLLHHAAAVRARPAARPLLRALPARRRVRRGGDRPAAVQQPLRHADHRGARGLPRPPLALRAPGGDAAPSAAGGVPHAVLHRGWGLYAEQLMRERGFFTDPRHELGQVEARLFRAARMVVDTSLHLGEMDVEQATDFMATRPRSGPTPPAPR